LAWAVNWWATDGVDVGDTVSVSITSGASLWPSLHTADWAFRIKASSHAEGGVAGFDAAWDQDPGNPTSEPTPGSGNPFWDGPKTLSSSGTAHLADAGPGCHYLVVRAWDNLGFSNVKSFGPVCYETCANETGKHEGSYGSACGDVCVSADQTCCADRVCAVGDVCTHPGGKYTPTNGVCCAADLTCRDACLTCDGFVGECGGVGDSCGHFLECGGSCPSDFLCEENVCKKSTFCPPGEYLCDGRCGRTNCSTSP